MEIPFITIFAIAAAVAIVTLYLFAKSTRLSDFASTNENNLEERVQQKLNRIWTWRFQNIPNKFYGHGCNYKFDHYISGESKIEIRDLDELCDWLLACTYIPDFIKKGMRDHWAHPDEFEFERSGDCEDFALWTWRKLKEMRIQADFTVGKWIHADGRIGTHAWVMINHVNGNIIFETTGRSKERMLKPFDHHKHEYIPFAAVDTDLRKKVYNGIVYWLSVLKEKYVKRHQSKL